MALYARRSTTATSFDDYVSSLRWTPPKPPDRAPSPAAGVYAGSTVCRECHAPVYEQWQSTGMAKMFRAYRAADVIGDFSASDGLESARALRAKWTALHRDRRPSSIVHRPSSGASLETMADRRRPIDDEWTRYPVDYVIGSKWQQAYATRLPDSRILVFPIQYSRNKSSWLNYWGIVDAPGSERADISRFHAIPDGAIYQTACAPCHTSQLKFSEGIEKASSGSFREGGINCEMCHGPSLAHVERIKSGGASGLAASHDTPTQLRRMPAQQYVACVQPMPRAIGRTQCRRGRQRQLLRAGAVLSCLSRASPVELLTEGVFPRRPLPGHDVHQRVICTIAVLSGKATRPAGRAMIPIRPMHPRTRHR